MLAQLLVTISVISIVGTEVFVRYAKSHERVNTAVVVVVGTKVLVALLTSAGSQRRGYSHRCCHSESVNSMQ